VKRAGGPKVAGRAATGRKPPLRTASSVGNLAVMRWTAAAAAVLVSSIWAIARAQTATTSALAPDGGAPPPLEDGGIVSRPFSAAPDGGVASFGPTPGPGSTQILRRNGVDYVGNGRISAAAPDAGATADNGTGGDAGVRQTASSAETDDLRRRISALEQRLSAATDQRQELDRLNQQISELRQQLAQVESQRMAAQQQVVESRVQTQQAVNTLQAAQQALTNGNGDVAATLSSVAPSLPAAAQRELAAAQQALGSNDLYAARAHISAAIAASQR